MRVLVIFFCLSSFLLHSQEPSKIKIAKEICDAALLKRPGGNITKAELRKCDSVFLRGNCDYKIISYHVTCCYPGHLEEIIATNVHFTPEIKSNLSKLDIGYRFFIEEIKVMDNKGQVYKLPDLAFKVTTYP